jgi:hypothetical protein
MANNLLAILGDTAPTDFDVITDTSAHNGNWSGITIIAATFPNNTTGILVEGEGRNLSTFNDQIPDGYMLPGNFTRITLTSGMVIAHKRRQS